MKRKKKTVSLVLGSGGARGLAHIGVIEWLDEQGYEIRSICGASMGALVGGIYAAGELDAYRHWVCALDRSDVLRLLDPTLGWTGIIKGKRVMDKLHELIGDRNIEDLSISFTAVASDVEAQREVWLSKGMLFDAIRASIAVPLVFTPHRINGRLLLDGGLLNPLPIAPTLRDDTDITIAVNLNGQPPMLDPRESDDSDNPVKLEQDVPQEEQAYSDRIKAFIGDLQERFTPGKGDDPGWDYFDIFTLSMETMQNTISRIKSAAYSPDYTIVVPRDSARAFEFWRAREMIALGRDRAAAMLDPERQ